MKEYHQFYINGSWVDPINGLNKLDVLSPATEESIGSLPEPYLLHSRYHLPRIKSGRYFP